MDKYFKWKVLLIVAAVAFSIWRFYPPQEKINLGLDLRGGMQLVLEVQTDKVPIEARKDATDRVVEVVRNRIDEFGVSEPVISKQGKNQVVVQLPGVTDRNRAKAIIEKSAHLEFKLVADNPDALKKAEETGKAEGYELKEIKGPNGINEKVLLNEKALLTGDHLTTASVGFDQYGQAIVQLQFDKEGAKEFDQITYKNIGKQLAIVLDGKVHSAPVIRDRIPSGTAQISGNFSADEASDLALILRAGALPAPVKIIEERSVGATLGKDSIHNSVTAGIIGILIVVFFMPLYYLAAGLIASIGLLFYIIITAGALAAVHATLTLPGIAGFILSVGMAVDANVLINERIREEIQTGKTPRAAVSAGYHKAFSAIIDSHVTTLLTGVILFIFGTGPVQGFGVTLSMGIIASLFSAIFITRVIFDFVLKKNPNMNLKMNQLFKNPQVHFLKGRFFAYGFSVITLAIGLSSLMMRGSHNYGVEFTGGTSAYLKFNKTVDLSNLRTALEKVGVQHASLQRFGDDMENEFIIKTPKSDTKEIEKAAADLVGEKEFQVLKVDEIGPAVSGDLSKKAMWAILVSALGILIYLGVRFEWKFSLAAVIALFHDTLFTFGAYALSGREINLPTIAAILTIMGFSVSDTIVTFDRIRDNLKIMRKVSFNQIVETSINQTLSRTVLTSMTVIVAALALFLFGGEAINDFAFTMLVGFSIGIYSSVFVATALAVDWKAH